MGEPNQVLAPDELISEVTFGSARGGKRLAAPLVITVVRALTPEDLPAINSPPPVASPGQLLGGIRHAHHQIAQLLVKGVPQVEISLLTGYSPSYISVLKSDPTFVELLDHYKCERELVFADVLERMKALGIATIDELQARLLEAPEKWTKSELLAMAEVMLKPSTGGSSGSGGGSAGPVTLNVNFVSAKREEAPRTMVDVTPKKEESPDG